MNMNSVDAIEASGFTRFFSGDFNSEKVELIGKTLSAYVRSILSRDKIIQELIEDLRFFIKMVQYRLKTVFFHCLDKEFAVDVAESGFREFLCPITGD